MEVVGNRELLTQHDGVCRELLTQYINQHDSPGSLQQRQTHLSDVGRPVLHGGEGDKLRAGRCYNTACTRSTWQLGTPG